MEFDGEPLLYAGGVGELFTRLRERGISTALDTCGAVPFENFETVLPENSLILYDIKGMDSAKHRANTGKDNRLILENLARHGKGSVPIEIRMPIIPSCNDSNEEVVAAGKFLAQLPAIIRVRLLAYHSQARGKYRAAGLSDTMPDVPPPSGERLVALAGLLRNYLHCEVLVPEAS